MSVDKKMLVYWQFPGLCTFFFKTSTWYILLMLYYAVVKTVRDSLDFFPMVMPKPCSGDFHVIMHVMVIKLCRFSQLLKVYDLS